MKRRPLCIFCVLFLTVQAIRVLFFGAGDYTSALGQIVNRNNKGEINLILTGTADRIDEKESVTAVRVKGNAVSFYSGSDRKIARQSVFGKSDDQSKMRAFIRENNIGLAVDATHPFARQVTENICAACEEEKIKYVRCLRERETNDPADHAGETSDGRPISAASVEEAVEYLKKTGGNVLISTGSKELHLYTRIKDYKERCFARVLSTQEAVAEAVRLGFEGKHLIAMQGPYSEELNLAMLKHINAAYFVTKESGGAGGFEEKKKAAQKAGAELIVIARPKEEGKSLQEVKKLMEEFLAKENLL